jgi:hypothetical protein
MTALNGTVKANNLIQSVGKIGAADGLNNLSCMDTSRSVHSYESTHRPNLRVHQLAVR